MDAPTGDIDACRRSTGLLLDALAGLTDDQARSPSLLPAWSVGHLLTHLARNADSTTRRLEGAARGEVVDQYPGGYAGRAADIEDGAGRTAAELVADVRDSAARLEATALSLPADGWGRPTRDVSGAERPAGILPYRRWREVEIHHVDLGLGYTPDRWPDELVSRILAEQLPALPRRTDPNALAAWALHRGPAPELGPW
jgi:maleylpyruvate isomerase